MYKLLILRRLYRFNKEDTEKNKNKNKNKKERNCHEFFAMVKFI